MLSSALLISDRDLDVDRCLRSGQVFRWTEDAAGFTVRDGGNEYRLQRTDGVYSCSNFTDAHRFFRLDWDAETVSREIIARGPELAPYLEAHRGLRLLRPADPVETIFSFVCTANNHLKRIKPMVEHLASYAEAPGFPDLQALSNIPAQALRTAGFGYRAERVPATAQRLLARGGKSYLAQLRAAPYDDLFKELIELAGVGPKLADCIALFAFDCTEAVPLDTHIWQAVTRLYFPDWRGVGLTANRYRAASEFMRNRFGGLAGWAQQALFFDGVLNWRETRRTEGRLVE